MFTEHLLCATVGTQQRKYSCFFAQEWALSVLREPYVLSQIEPRMATWQAANLPAVSEPLFEILSLKNFILKHCKFNFLIVCILQMKVLSVHEEIQHQSKNCFCLSRSRGFNLGHFVFWYDPRTYNHCCCIILPNYKWRKRLPFEKWFLQLESFWHT